MALFKINKGKQENLPGTYVEGYAYFTTDTGRFLIDTGTTAAERKYINPDSVIDITRNGTTFTMTKVDGSTDTFDQAAVTITLNGATVSSPSFYAPTGAGTNGYVLKSNGSGAPTWLNPSSLSVGSATKATQDANGDTISSTYLKLSGGAMSGQITLANGGLHRSSLNFLFTNYDDFQHSSISPGNTAGNDDFFKALLKSLGEKYPGYGQSVVIGEAGPNSQGPLYGHTYGTSLNSDGLPQYCTFWFNNLGGGLEIFGTSNYNFYRKFVLDSSNYNNYAPTKTGGGASGTWGISISGNASTATKATQDGSGNTITSTYLKLSGGTMTGQIKGPANNNSWIGTTKGGIVHMKDAPTGGAAAPVISMKTATGSWSLTALSGADNLYFVWGSDTSYDAGTNDAKYTYITKTAQIFGAVWNDYAEYRSQIEELKPGYIVYSEDDGKLRITTERLQKFEGVVSDTYGFAIGKTDECKTPLAVSGRVLVYCNPEEKFHSGDCVCAGPGGLAYRMTREEIIQFPDRIVGIVSEIPTYERWGTGDVEVNGRIWIKVR